MSITVTETQSWHGLCSGCDAEYARESSSFDRRRTVCVPKQPQTVPVRQSARQRAEPALLAELAKRLRAYNGIEDLHQALDDLAPFERRVINLRYGLSNGVPRDVAEMVVSLAGWPGGRPRSRRVQSGTCLSLGWRPILRRRSSLQRRAATSTADWAVEAARDLCLLMVTGCTGGRCGRLRGSESSPPPRLFARQHKPG